MKLLKLVFPVLLFFMHGYSFGQVKHEWLDIKLSVRHSMRIPNNFVEISIKRNRLNKKVVNVEIKSVPLYDSDQWKCTKLDTVFTASLVDYSKIVASVKFIKQEDLYNNLSLLGIDGYNTTLSFGDSSNSITYSIFGPTYDTVERKLVPYLKTCELILAYAGLNIEDIFEKHVDKKKYSN